MTTITIEQIHKFLLGEAPLDGVWFGDKHPTERGTFWWRKYLSAELAKPEQEESFIPDWANYRQGVADGKAGNPKWHDAPTCAGWWVRNSYEGIGVYSISEPSIKFLKGSVARWYGPICEDAAIAKAEGGAA